MSAVVSGIKSVGKTIFGGSSKPGVSANYGAPSEQEGNLEQNLTGNAGNEYQNELVQGTHDQGSSNEISELFKKHLAGFLSHSNPNDPDAQQAAQEWVDKTFTQPAQAAVNQNISDYESTAQARAAALGRNPNLDVATNQAIAGEVARQNIGLNMQRGQMINDRYNQNFQQGLQGLGAGMQGSGYFNQLAQNAANNRLNLMNLQSNNLNYLQRGRSQGFTGMQTEPGLLGSITSGIGQVAGLGKAVGGLGKSLGFGG